MPEEIAYQGTTGTSLPAEDWGSWEIEHVVKEKALIITVTDYHAGPMKISVNQLKSMLRRLEPESDPIQCPTATTQDAGHIQPC